MEKTWMPPVAGTLNIIAGSIQLLGGMIFAIIGLLASSVIVQMITGYMVYSGIAPSLVTTVLILIAIALIVPGILAIIGGVFAIKRTAWGMAMTGSIFAFLFTQSILAIPAIIFLALSREEFK